MTEKLEHVKVVIAAFQLQEENSVYYRKLDTPDDAKLGAAINIAIHDKKADVISIRAVRAQ